MSSTKTAARLDPFEAAAAIARERAKPYDEIYNRILTGGTGKAAHGASQVNGGKSEKAAAGRK